MCPGFLGVRFLKSLDNHFVHLMPLSGIFEKKFCRTLLHSKRLSGESTRKGAKGLGGSLRFVSFGFFARCRILSFVYCLMYLIVPEFEMDEDSCYR